MPSLFVTQGDDQGRRFDLDGEICTIGRGPENQISLRDSEVSRRHAELRRDERSASFCIKDLDSSNGVFVNGQRVRLQALRSGDRLQLGKTLMLYTGSEDAGLADLARSVDIISSEESSQSRIVRSSATDDDSGLYAAEPTEDLWLARARSNLDIMYRTALAASHTLDIDQLLSRILELIFEWVEADRGCILMPEPPSREFLPRVRYNRPGRKFSEKMSISRTILDYVLANREGVLTSDAREDERWDPGGSIIKLGVTEAICVPMQGRYGTVGLIYIDTYTAPGELLRQTKIAKFRDEHLKLMIAIGHQAALAVEDTSYYRAMVQAERLAAVGQTIAGLAHHVKNILQGIRGGSYLIEEGLRLEQPEIVRRGWRIVDRNQERVSRLVLDMLTFSKERQPEWMPASLLEVVRDVVELMQPHAEERQVQVHVRPGENIPRLLFDPEGIHHALLNVVTNAIDACASQGGGTVELEIVLQADRKRVQVRVHDDGPGIPSAELSEIFLPFTSKKGNRGTGLGLSVTQKILREHGGDVHVESQLEKGSLFTLEWPLRLADAYPMTNEGLPELETDSDLDVAPPRDSSAVPAVRQIEQETQSEIHPPSGENRVKGRRISSPVRPEASQ